MKRKSVPGCIGALALEECIREPAYRSRLLFADIYILAEKKIYKIYKKVYTGNFDPFVADSLSGGKSYVSASLRNNF